MTDRRDPFREPTDDEVAALDMPDDLLDDDELATLDAQDLDELATLDADDEADTTTEDEDDDGRASP